MLAFRLEADDHPPLVAGTEDWALLLLHINAARASAYKRETDDLDLTVNGMTKVDDAGVAHHFRWPRIPLKVGSRVLVTLIETQSPDPPINRFRSDRDVQENPFTEEEQREMRRQDYLRLKKEFEGET